MAYTIQAKELETWLTPILKNENLTEWTIDIAGKSSTGDGFVSDIVFVEVNGFTSQNTPKKYNFVLKCGKRGSAFTDIFPIKLMMETEMMVYEKIFATFAQFQREKNIQEPFDSVPKYYGKFSDVDTKVIVIEDLKSAGFEMWDRTKPWERSNVESVVREYGKFHALSVALRDQKPELFEQITKDLCGSFNELFKPCNMFAIYENIIDEVAQFVDHDFDSESLKKWNSIRDLVDSSVRNMYGRIESVNVVIHGDCWNSNFLLMNDVNVKNNPLFPQIMKIDWQIARLSSPVLDLSYFLFSCTSKEDLETADQILDEYYNSFASFLRQLGSDPDLLYSRSLFWEEWSKYGLFGVVMSLVPLKGGYLEQEDVPDLIKAAEEKPDLSAAFASSVAEELKEAFKDRLLGIVKYALRKNLMWTCYRFS